MVVVYPIVWTGSLDREAYANDAMYIQVEMKGDLFFFAICFLIGNVLWLKK